MTRVRKEREHDTLDLKPPESAAVDNFGLLQIQKGLAPERCSCMREDMRQSASNADRHDSLHSRPPDGTPFHKSTDIRISIIMGVPTSHSYALAGSLEHIERARSSKYLGVDDAGYPDP